MAMTQLSRCTQACMAWLPCCPILRACVIAPEEPEEARRPAGLSGITLDPT